MELMRLAPSRVTHLALINTNAWPDVLRQKIYRGPLLARSGRSWPETN
jgi:hypothetical protein